jgi:hypothetical protein
MVAEMGLAPALPASRFRASMRPDKSKAVLSKIPATPLSR